MSAESSPVTNALEWSVSDLSGALKRTVEDQFGFVRVRGEISGYRGPVASGHAYFSLKDESARIDAVVWKGVLGRLRTKPQEGLEVIATGKVTTFPGKSSYQIIIDAIEPAGLGALMALLEERRRRLAAEGLFDEARKQFIPYLPEVIGVITSPTGAVIRDILHRLEDRFPRRVLVWPVRVQGETSGAEVAAAIRGFNALPPGGAIPRPDVLIVARGGGSLEDLMSFNDEAVVRAAAASDIPLISAVGHETDWTLIDQAADLRAPTPTAAAEKVVPVRIDLVAAVGGLDRRRQAAIARAIDQRRQGLRAAARALPSRDTLLNLPRQRLDLATARLPAALRANAREHERRLLGLARRLQARSPQMRLAIAIREVKSLNQRLTFARQTILRAEEKRIAAERQALARLSDRALRALRTLLDRQGTRFVATVQVFESMNYKAVLRRGFAIVRTVDKESLRSVAGALPGAALTVELADGEFAVTVNGGTPSQPRPAARPKPAAPLPGLFD